MCTVVLFFRLKLNHCSRYYVPMAKLGVKVLTIMLQGHKPTGSREPLEGK